MVLGFRITRRRRLTLLKCFLIASAIGGVLFWFRQVRNVPSVDNSGRIVHIERSNYEDSVELGSLRRSWNKVKQIENGDSSKQESILHEPPKMDNLLLDIPKNEISENKQIPVPNFIVPLVGNAVPEKTSKRTAGLLKHPFHDKNIENSVQIDIKLKELPVRVPDHIRDLSNPKYSDEVIKFTPGLGENGSPVFLSGDEQKAATEMFNIAAFNVYISDRIALNRSVPDPRHKSCKNVQYGYHLPTASVIIIFTNEILSALLRTIYSVINRSPRHLLKEIILVDDNSDREDLKQRLELYIAHHFSAIKVKLIRMPKREGLIRARLAGAKSATGDVLVFLDSHCETNKQWLEPLLQRIKENRKAVLCPIIDVIDDKTLEYFANNGEYFQIGGFTWNGHFTWIEIPESEEKRRHSEISPVRSPTMAGGLFAINRNYFWEIGSYDAGMNIWGGENLEMSFRVWMCGGTLEIVPCSHVGHIFRNFHPYTFPDDADTHGINTVRTIEVWMNDYKKYFYMHRPDLRDIHYGDISDRLLLRKKLKCKSFQWYLKNIYPQKFIHDQNVTGYGIVRNPISHMCLDILNRNEDQPHFLGLFQCKSEEGVVINQLFSFSYTGELRREENCAEVSSASTRIYRKVIMTKCHGRKGEQQWYHQKGGPVIHVPTELCLDSKSKGSGQDVYVTACHGGHSQIWWFENYLDIRPMIEVQQYLEKNLL